MQLEVYLNWIAREDLIPWVASNKHLEVINSSLLAPTNFRPFKIELQ